MTCKIKRRSLRCGGRPKADFGSLFTSVIAPALNTTGSIVDESIDNNKTTTNGVVNKNTIIPSDPTKTPTMRLGGRKKCWIGAAIGAATSITGSLFGAAAQKREMRRQKSIQDWQNTTQEAANMTTALNNSQDYQEDYLRQFRTAARLGKTLGAKGIYITDGGDATKIGNNTYLLRGGSHEDVNETGQTGIGINVGGNEVEAEGGEVAQKKNGALRIFSAQPILGNGMSPAQAILRGYNKDKVFSQQQAFKKRNGLKDDGSKAQTGGCYEADYPFTLSMLLSIIYDKTLGRFDSKNPYLITGTAPIPGRCLSLKQIRSGLVTRNMLPTNRVYRITNMREVKDAKAIGQYRKLPKGIKLPKKTVVSKNGRTFSIGKVGGNSHGGKAATMGEPWTGTTSGGYNESKYVISTPSRHTVWQVGHHGSYYEPLPADAIKKGSALWKKFDAEGNTGISTKRMVVYKDLGNGLYLRIPKNKYRLGGLTSKRRNHLSDGRNTYKNGGSANKPRFRHVKNYGFTDATPYPNDEIKPTVVTSRLNPFESLAKFVSRNLMELGRTGLLDHEGLNVAQDSYLVPTKAIQAKMFADAGYTRDYNAEKNRNYGLVKKGVGNRNIPIYSRTNPSFGKQRKDLVVLGNSYNIDNVNKALVHARSYPSAIYSDNEDNIYINSWDLNDYGADAAGNTGDLNDHYGSFRKKLAKAVDVVGNPTVITTGYQKALDNNKPIKISNYSDYYNLSNNGNNEAIKEALDNWMTKQGVELNEVGYGSPLVEIIGKRKYRLGGRCKLRNGGLTSKDRGSSKHQYPSVSSKDFAGGGRSYPIPTKADAVDALRLAGLHGRSDVRSKVYSKYPSLRKKSLLGSYSRPVKGMRPKAAIGIFVPYNKRYTSIYDAPDYDSDYNGGNVLGNGEVTVTAKRIKPTFMKPNNDAMNIINHSANETPYIPQRHNRSRTIFSGGDYLGLGIDTLAALSTGLVNYNTAGKYVLPDRAPIIQASKLPTTYNVNPEIEEVKRYRDRLTGQTFNNTSSSVAALNRSSAINLDALSNLSKLWATKENEENKMLTEDAKNQQTVAAQNVQNELARQSEIARIKNEAIQAKGDALNVGLSGLSQAWTNFWTAGRTAYEDDQSRRAMIASSKDATPTRLIEMGYDLSPDLVASLYGTAKDDRTKRFYLSRLSSAQRQKYGIN